MFDLGLLEEIVLYIPVSWLIRLALQSIRSDDKTPPEPRFSKENCVIKAVLDKDRGAKLSTFLLMRFNEKWSLLNSLSTQLGHCSNCRRFFKRSIMRCDFGWQRARVLNFVVLVHAFGAEACSGLFTCFRVSFLNVAPNDSDGGDVGLCWCR